MKKKLLSLALTLVLCLGLAVPAFAYCDMGQVGTASTISTGGQFSAAVKSDGSLWMWGENEYYQLGSGSIRNDNYGPGTDSPIQTVPAKLMDDVVSVSCGRWCAAAIKKDGTLWMWGWWVPQEMENSKNGHSYFGNYCIETPKKVLDNVAAVSCGQYYIAAVKTDGSLWMVGLNTYGQFGNGKCETAADDNYCYELSPVRVMDNVAAVACDDQNTAILKTDGTLWTCGWGTYGEVGNGKDGRDNEKVPNPVKILDNVVSMSPCAALCSDGSVWTWGTTYPGNGTRDRSLVPVKVMDGAVKVACTTYTGAIIKADGSLWMWGDNDERSLNKERGSVLTPIKIMDDVADVSISGTLLAVKTDGTLWSWGDNLHGQVGNGHWGFNNFVTTPTQVLSGVAIPARPAPTVGGFLDVHENDYFAEPVQWAVDKKITSGTSGNTFSPKKTCSVGEILTFLWKANGSPEPAIENPFTDTIPTGFQKAAVWAAEKGLVSGSAFGSSTPCTRASTMEYIWKAAGSPAPSGQASFVDVSANADYAQAVAWAVEQGITGGTGNNRFSPDATCTRGQIATFLYKAFAK